MPRPPYTNPVDADLLERVASDPGWAAKVIVAAGQTLNLLAYYAAHPEAQRRAFRAPNAEAITAQDLLRQAFINWNDLDDLVQCVSLPAD